MVQRLRLHVPSAEGTGLILCWGTKISRAEQHGLKNSNNNKINKQERWCKRSTSSHLTPVPDDAGTALKGSTTPRGCVRLAGLPRLLPLLAPRVLYPEKPPRSRYTRMVGDPAAPGPVFSVDKGLIQQSSALPFDLCRSPQPSVVQAPRRWTFPSESSASPRAARPRVYQ